MNELKLTVSVAPHIRVKEDAGVIMRDVLISLSPAVIASCVFFGWRAPVQVATSIITCVLTEFIFQKALKKPVTVNDYSAAVTGMLFAFIIPPASPIWMVIIGAVIAILLGKQIFGGLGNNPFNPALVSRAILLTSWPVAMTCWIRPFDSITCATPLQVVKMGLTEKIPAYLDMFIGNRAGCLGETSIAALLLGGLYLLFRKRIKLHIPLSFIGVVFVVSALSGRDPLFNVMAGGVVLGAFFMATDSVTSPITNAGKLIFGTGCGLLTMLIRYNGGYPEGVCYAILIMNMFTPLIDRFTEHKPFGR
jgi:electron transport complex protein RnfD